MTTPFGPQLIGSTEKTLNALLHGVLGSALTEPEWVTLKLAQQADGRDDLVRTVTDRAHFDDADGLVARLVRRGLVDVTTGRPTEAGTSLVADLQATIDARVMHVFDGLDAAEVDAAARVLNTVLERARVALIPAE